MAEIGSTNDGLGESTLPGETGPTPEALVAVDEAFESLQATFRAHREAVAANEAARARLNQLLELVKQIMPLLSK